MKTVVAVVVSLFYSVIANASIFSFIRWPHNEVKVCFVEKKENSKDPIRVKNFSGKDKENIQRWVEGEYSSSRTGIYFVGFKSCDQTESPNVIIYLNADTVYLGWGKVAAAEATIGRSLRSVSRDYPSAEGAIYMNSRGLNKSDVVHEFGHVAGLDHEHEHPQATKDCSAVKKGRVYHTGRGYFPYDRESVMNYCICTKYSDRGLSEGDVETLRKLYIDRMTYKEYLEMTKQ